ncbi:MAG: hypothetical protein ACKEQI_00390 [Candidatus Hodgkinia cicadicola]
MLSLGVYVILKKVTEEMAEFTIAICWDRFEGICKECADLIYHVLLLFVGFEIRYERLLETMKTKLNQTCSITSLMCLENLVLKVYDDINCDRNNKFKKARNIEGAIDVMIRKLYLSVASLTTICLKINISAEATESAISNIICEVLINALVLLHYRGVRYHEVVKVLISRCYH